MQRRVDAFEAERRTSSPTPAFPADQGGEVEKINQQAGENWRRRVNISHSCAQDPSSRDGRDGRVCDVTLYSRENRVL